MFSLVLELTLAQMKARYRGTLSGFIWVMLGPIFMYSAQSFIFKWILKVNIPHYSLFLLGGLLPWLFIVTSIQMGVPVFHASRQLLLSFKVQPWVLVMVSVMDNWINFLAAFCLVLIPSLYLGTFDFRGLLLLPFAILFLFAGATGFVCLFSVLNVFYRDVKFVTTFVFSILYFVTPVFYPLELLPTHYHWIVWINPLYHLIAPVRECIYGFSFQPALQAMARSALTALLALGMAALYWKKRRNDFYHYV